MSRDSDLRQCFREPIAALFDVARLLDAAAVAHLSGDRNLAADLLRSADIPVVREWVNSIWGAKSKYVVYRATPDSRAALPKHERVSPRMPTLETRQRLHQRDGFHCRCCGVPVVRTEVRAFFVEQYPELKLWSAGNANQHAGFQALRLQYDHILPHALGGTNEFGNLVITCAACNYGRMHYTFAEVGLQNPLLRSPVQPWWEGIERVLPSSPFRSHVT